MALEFEYKSETSKTNKNKHQKYNLNIKKIQQLTHLHTPKGDNLIFGKGQLLNTKNLRTLHFDDPQTSNYQEDEYSDSFTYQTNKDQTLK